MITDEFLNTYRDNLTWAIKNNEFACEEDYYDIESINKDDLPDLAKNIVDITREVKRKIEDSFSEETCLLNISVKEGKVIFTLPLAIVNVICLQYKIKRRRGFPSNCFIKDETLFWLKTPYFLTSCEKVNPDIANILYALAMFESLEVTRLVLLKTKDDEFSPESIDFIYELNKNFGKEIIFVQEINVVEADFCNTIFNLANKPDLHWKPGFNGYKTAQINLKENLDAFKLIETVAIQGKIKFTYCTGPFGNTKIITPPETDLKCPYCGQKVTLRRAIGFPGSGIHSFIAHCKDCDKEIKFDDSELWKNCLEIALNKHI